ncbi:hypothetical protein [Actinomadura madurae]|uniref:hypothetical protein n=1 Tax=Actinomadura madurae TaxID=1993 RepID=UPI0020D21E7E|nr:hypothetical protein [Actinomadura madurae]MCP9947181.1 hypothetical protein [Actinomadura madurae]MCP9963947.1 hypothetical protein [Actinomadura madurae]MCP9976421.1 hypothetical protein [Actinomadura madurae]MCQ0012086.1 hypothetical protein [Actinomadura madurae]MCQ0012614.1 hypothetical protein [Actinomadura madurae]
MTESLASRLALAATQLTVISEQIGQAGVTADDGEAIGDYLVALAEHGYHVSTKALLAVENADDGHPARGALHGMDLQASLAHASEMFHAAIHFAAEAGDAADAMAGGDTTS